MDERALNRRCREGLNRRISRCRSKQGFPARPRHEQFRTGFGSFVGIDLAFAGVPHRVVLGRAFLESVIMFCDGFCAQVTFANSPERG